MKAHLKDENEYQRYLRIMFHIFVQGHGITPIKGKIEPGSEPLKYDGGKTTLSHARVLYKNSKKKEITITCHNPGSSYDYAAIIRAKIQGKNDPLGLLEPNDNLHMYIHDEPDKKYLVELIPMQPIIITIDDRISMVKDMIRFINGEEVDGVVIDEYAKDEEWKRIRDRKRYTNILKRLERRKRIQLIKTCTLTEEQENDPEYIQEKIILGLTYHITKTMNEKSITKEELGKRIGRKKGYITRYLNGFVPITIKNITEIFIALDMKLRITLGDSE